MEIIKETTFWSEYKIEIIGISIAFFTFVIERILAARREKKSDNYQWFLTIIVQPQLDDINSFYQQTFEQLDGACENLKCATVINIDYHIKKRVYCEEFKDRRRLFFNNFVSIVGSFDSKMAFEIERLINQLDDCYVRAIDFPNTKEIVDSTKHKIYENRANVYKTLFSKFS